MYCLPRRTSEKWWLWRECLGLEVKEHLVRQVFRRRVAAAVAVATRAEEEREVVISPHSVCWETPLFGYIEYEPLLSVFLFSGLFHSQSLIFG